MEVLNSLVNTSELKTNLFGDTELHKIVYFHYDDVFDAFTLMLVEPDQKTIVHYLDDHVGLLYIPETLEVVGFQIEAFEHSFIPENENVGKVWAMDFSDNEEKDFGKIVFEVGRMKPKIVKEVVRASKPYIENLIDSSLLNRLVSPDLIYADY